MAAVYSMAELQRRQDERDSESALRNPPEPACYITDEGWFFEIGKDMWQRGGPAPENSEIYPRRTIMVGCSYTNLKEYFPVER